jgi:predicted phage terminase large subunit-like protein
VIVSDTVSQAVQFLGDIKKEIIDNDQLRSIFKIKEFVKESEDDFIVLCEDGHSFRVQAKGSEQKVRGLKWNRKRPDLIMCDDLENDEIVMNKERREKFKRWFFAALIPCLSANGIVRYVGTILHSDSLLENLMPKVYDKKTIIEPLRMYNTNARSAWKSVKYRAHTDDFTQFLWPERFDRDWFITKRTELLERGLSQEYSQEYLNIPIDETVSYFKRVDFLAMTKEDRQKSIRYYITADLAVSKESQADYSVFVVSGIDEARQIQVRNVVRERLDGREIVDMILSLEKIYKPEVFGIEEMQVSQAIGPFLREEMIRTNVFPNLVHLKHGGKDKMARGKSMQARVRAHTVKFDKDQDWYQTFEDECCSFPRARNDDQFDAFAYLGMLLDIVIEAPTQYEIEEEHYLDELREYESDSGINGRSQITGY